MVFIVVYAINVLLIAIIVMGITLIAQLVIILLLNMQDLLGNAKLVVLWNVYGVTLIDINALVVKMDLD